MSTTLLFLSKNLAMGPKKTLKIKNHDAPIYAHKSKIILICLT
jgi:hypothetical protein